MPTASPSADDGYDAPELSRGRLQGKRAALVVVIGVAVLFVGASAAQIIPAVFGMGIAALSSDPAHPNTRTCAEGIRGATAALARTAPGARRAGEGAARATLPQEEWDPEETVARACAASSEGLDSWAALMRLRSAQAQLQPSDSAELVPLRRDVAAHLAADLR